MDPSRRSPPAIVALLLVTALVVMVVVIRELVSGGPTQVPRSGEEGPVTRIADDFSSRSGWATFSSEKAALSYVQGGYRLLLDRPGDDGLSVLVLPGRGWPSVAASAAVEERAPIGGLVGVGCAADKEHAYVGAVDPASSGFVIVRADGSAVTLLRYGANEDGTIRPVPEENRLQIQCSVRGSPGPRTSIRLFANGRFLAAYQDPRGLGPFKGVALGGVSLRRSLDAVFTRVALQSLPSAPPSPDVTACDRLVAATSLEDDYGWLVDSGGTRLNSQDFDTRQVLRIARELGQISTGLQADARVSAAGGKVRRSLRNLAARLRAQGDALNSLTSAINRGPIDTTGPYRTMSCPEPRFFAPPTRAPRPPGGESPRTKAAHQVASARDIDRRLTRDLPVPVFIADDETLPAEPELGVDVDLTYRTYRVFGASIADLNRSLRVHAIYVEGEEAAGVTDSRFEWSYQPIDLASGCALVPGVTLTLVITVPDWRPPASADRYLRNQWNQFMWDLDEHERHHAELWVKAANRMIVAINGAPPQPNCRDVIATAKARVARVFKAYERMQRAFDRNVAAGRLPGPSLP